MSCHIGLKSKSSLNSKEQNYIYIHFKKQEIKCVDSAHTVINVRKEKQLKAKVLKSVCNFSSEFDYMIFALKKKTYFNRKTDFFFL